MGTGVKADVFLWTFLMWLRYVHVCMCVDVCGGGGGVNGPGLRMDN